MNSDNMVKMTLPSGEEVLTDAKIRLGPSKIAGTGAFAIRRLRKDELLGEYTGELITSEEADRRHAESDQFYTFQLESGTCIDPTNDETCLLKYLNHSCDPNCETEEDEDGHIMMRTIKEVQPGEELTFDYQVISEDDDEVKCRCGAPNCKGTMRAEDDDEDDE